MKRNLIYKFYKRKLLILCQKQHKKLPEDEKNKLRIKTIASFEEAIENGLNLKESYNLALLDISSVYTNETKKVLKILFTYLLAFIQIMFFTFNILQFEVCSFYKMHSSFFNVLYLLSCILLIIYSIYISKKNSERVMFDKTIKTNIFLIIQFIPILFGWVNGVHNEMYLYFYFFTYFAFLPISISVIYVLEIINFKKIEYKDLILIAISCCTSVCLFEKPESNSYTFDFCFAAIVFLLVLLLFTSLLKSLHNQKTNNPMILKSVIFVIALISFKLIDYAIFKCSVFDCKHYFSGSDSLIGPQFFCFPEGFSFLIFFCLFLIYLNRKKVNNDYHIARFIYEMFLIICFIAMCFSEYSTYKITLKQPYGDGGFKVLMSVCALYSINYTFLFLWCGYLILSLWILKKSNASSGVYPLRNKFERKINSKVKWLLAIYGADAEFESPLLAASIDQFNYLVQQGSSEKDAIKLAILESNNHFHDYHIDSTNARINNYLKIQLLSFLLSFFIVLICDYIVYDFFKWKIIFVYNLTDSIYISTCFVSIVNVLFLNVVYFILNKKINKSLYNIINVVLVFFTLLVILLSLWM